jgi:hypothetical protein
MRVAGADSLDRLVVDDTTYHVCPSGEAGVDRGEEELRGYRGSINDYAYIGGEFKDWDQYATFLSTGEADAHINVQASANNVGNSDIFRAGSDVAGGGTITFGGAVTGVKDNGDRGFIIETANAPAVVNLDNIVVDAGYVGCEVQAGETIIGTVTLSDMGDPDAGENQKPLTINDKSAPIGSVHLRVHISSSDSSVTMDPAIELLEQNSNWSDETHVIEGIAKDYENTQVDDQTDAGTTINTARLFG